MFRHSSFILLYSTLLFILLLITFCNGGKPGKKEKKKLIKNQGDDEGNANANQFLHSIQPHFEKFGTPFELLEQEKDYIIKRNARKGNVEWRLTEIKRNMRINFSEFSILDERNAGIETKVLAPAMTEYANCVKKLEKMKIKPNENTRKLFMLNGAITILDMKPIAGKRHAFRVKYVPEFLDREQIIEPVPTHFCTSLFIVENNGKIGDYELICTRIDRWTERVGPPRNIGKMKDCGHSELYDHQLDEHLVNSGAENMLEYVQIKLAMDLIKMLKRLELADMVEGRKHKKNDQTLPTSSINSADEHQIERMDPNLRIYKGFMVEYDPRKLVANWLLERLTNENASTKNQAERLKWIADPKLPKMFQPIEEDYHMAKQFKLNHGHLAGFRAHRNNDEYQETFFYPNSLPQDRKINSGYWRVIEEYALCLAGHKQSIAYIYTGPLYIPEKNENTNKWNMKYKIIGKRKMMAVPTHLFKIIFLEFTNNDWKKSYWLESLVVSNGQEEEEEGIEEEIEEEQIDELEIVEEEGEGIQVEVEMGNNIWYNLDKDEAEIEQMLKETHKLNKGKEKAISEATMSVKNIESIQALVKGCQNRRYKIAYGDANSLVDIGGLLKEHRKSLTYIDKFAPHFQLLAKLPPQIRSKAYGIRFDEEKLAEFFSKNEKRKDKDLSKESGGGNEKEEKIKSEEESEATSSRKYDDVKGRGTKAKGGKLKKKQKQEGKQPAVSIHVDEGTETAEVLTAGMLMTMEDLDKYCQNLDKRQKLLRKHRHELENLLAKKLKSLFFTQELGMSDYHLEVKLPAKLIKMAGIKGFMYIARKHPLIMINFFNMETVDALLNAYVSEEEKNNEMTFYEEKNRKIWIMIDLIFLQLKLSANPQIEVCAGEQEIVLTNQEIEKRNKIERAKSEGMDILMEWLDNSDMETTTMKMMTKEEREEHAKEIDEKASSAIGQLIKFEEGSIPGIEVGTDVNANQYESWREKWRSEWRDLTMKKLERKENDEKGKENIEEEKGKNAVNVASSSSFLH